MSLRISATFLFFLATVWSPCQITQSAEAELTHVHWNGFALYLTTSRQLIQRELDHWNELNSENTAGAKLYLPEHPVFSELDADQHVIYIDFGNLTFKDFVESESNNTDSRVSTTGVEVMVNIPLLADSPSGPPRYALALEVLYDRRRGDIPKPSFIYPYLPMDEVTLSDRELVVINGTEELRITCNGTARCDQPGSIVRHEFNDLYGDFQWSYGGPEGFDFCDGYPRANQYCSTVEDIEEDVERYPHDVCQKWGNSGNKITKCAASCEVVRMTPGFLEIIPLVSNEDIPIFLSERYDVVNGTLIIEYPCFK